MTPYRANTPDPSTLIQRSKQILPYRPREEAPSSSSTLPIRLYLPSHLTSMLPVHSGPPTLQPLLSSQGFLMNRCELTDLSQGPLLKSPVIDWPKSRSSSNSGLVPVPNACGGSLRVSRMLQASGRTGTMPKLYRILHASLRGSFYCLRPSQPLAL